MRGKQFGLLLGVAILGVVALLFSFPSKTQATAGINQQINYQARLLDSTGATVPDGNYNIEFKIYSGGTGCVSGGSSPCGGTLLWTEDEIGANKVVVKNGYMSVQLGAVTAFGGSVDWNNDTLWLSINIGGTGTPSYDGEMTPFRRMTSSPYAFNSSELGGLTSAQFLQLAPGSVQTDSSTSSSVFVNKTGASGNILELQKAGADVMVLGNTGALTLQNSADSTTALNVLGHTSGLSVFDVDTTNSRVGIGTSTPSAKLNIVDNLFSDNFNRSDSTNLGSNWTERTDAGTDFQIVSNQLKLTPTDNSANALSAYTTQGITGADYAVQSDIIFPSASDDWLSVFGRGSTFGTNDSQGYYAFASMANQKVAIYKRSAGTWTQLSTAPSVTINSGTTYNIKLVMQGTTLSLYWNGVFETSITDSTFSAAGFAGVAVGQPNLVNSIWDNFTILPIAASLNVNNNMAVTANGFIGVGTTSPSYAVDVQGAGDINATGVYRLNGTAGATTTCSGGQFLQNQVVSGGITTGGSCAAASGSGVATIGTIDSQTKSANGAVISGTSLVMQTADASNPGLVSTATQTFAGAKTVKVGSASAFVVQDASANNVLTVDTNTPAIVVGNDGTPSAISIRGGAATGSNITGANITVDASNGTGGGGSGDLIFRTAAASTSSAITIDGTPQSLSAGTGISSINWTQTPSTSTNSILLVSVVTDASHSYNSVSGVTYEGTNLTRLSTLNCPTADQAFGCHVELWYMTNPATTGTHQIVATLASGTSSLAGGSVVYKNINTSSPFGTVNTNSGSAGSNTQITNSVATTSTQQLVIDAFTANNTISAPSGTQLWSSSANSAISDTGSSVAANGGSTAVHWTVNFGDWGDIGVPLNPVANSVADTLADRLHITAAGNVGIGTASPTAVLNVNGATILQGSTAIENTAGTNSNDLTIQRAGTISSSNIQYTFNERTNNTDLWLYGYDGSTFWDPVKLLWNGGSGAQVLALGSDGGNVAVGTTSASHKLEVAGSGNFSTSVLSPLFDTATGVALDIGLNNASVINLDENTAVATNKSFTANGAALFQDATNSSAAFQVQNATAAPIFMVDTTSAMANGNTLNYLTYPGFESGSFSNAAAGWNSVSPGTLSQNTNKTQVYNGADSAQVVTTSSNGGLTTGSFVSAPPSGTYIVSFYAKVASGSATIASTAFTVQSTDGATHTCSPAAGITINSSGFQRLYCSITATGAITALQITQTDGTARTLYFDAMQLQSNSYNSLTLTAPTVYQIGGIQLRGAITSPVAIAANGDSTSAFQVQSASGNTVLAVDTTDSQLQLRNFNDFAPGGTELFTSSESFPATAGWTSISGTGSSATATHTASGGTTALNASPTITPTVGVTYKIVYTSSGRTTGTITASIGGATGAAITNAAPRTEYLYATTTAPFAMTPTTDYNGTITSLSISALVNSTPVIQVNDSSGAKALEIRAGGINDGVVSSNILGIGYGALQISAAGNNVAIGNNSMAATTSGGSNVAVGVNSLQNNITGAGNVGVGLGALKLNTTGADNVAMGFAAIQNGTTSAFNVGLGFDALVNSSTGNNNTAVGSNAMFGFSTITGSGNAALGDHAGYDITSASNNTFVGFQAGYQGNSQSQFKSFSTTSVASTGIGAFAQTACSTSCLVLGGQGADQANVGIGTPNPKNFFDVEPTITAAGTVTTDGTTGSVTGSGTNFTSSMIGDTVYIASNTPLTQTYSGVITAVGGTTSMTVSPVTFTAVSGASYYINAPGFQVKTDGTVYTQGTSTTQFQVQNLAATAQFIVDTTNSRVYIGDGSASATPTILVLDSKNTTDSLTPGTTTCTTTGAIFYNSTDSQFRACRNGLLFNLIAGVDVQTFTAASSTWTAPSGISTVMVVACGGGGSGGGGLTGLTSTARGGGSGGGGGARASLIMAAADAGTSQTVVVGQQVSGGNASATGTAGNPTTFGGTMVIAFGGGRGNAGQATTGPSGGGGGGFGVVGGNGSTTTVSGGDNASANAQGVGGAGGGDTTAAAGKAAELGGGGGGGSGIGTVGLAGGDSIWGGAGGGGGGGANASNVAANGASGGGNGTYASGDGVAGGAGNGSTGTAGNSIHCGGGGAGGGGSAAGTGSTGGPGGAAGGGGGGGGGGITGGAGGAGAAGKVWVFSW